MTYQYDVFLSYKHNPKFRPWITDRFLPILRSSLQAELGREPKFFLDLNELDRDASESTVISVLGRGLAHSRCLVAIWSVAYFRSVWCWNECQAFLKRRDLDPTTKRDDGTTRALILPIVVSNGALFPEFARATQWLDLRSFAMGFLPEKSRLGLEFHNAIRKCAHDLSEIIENSPEWQAHWLSDDWFDDEPPPQDDDNAVPLLH